MAPAECKHKDLVALNGREGGNPEAFQTNGILKTSDERFAAITVVVHQFL